MVIKLLSAQIPSFWEAIKFTAIHSGGVDEAHSMELTNELLQSLLSDKTQCFALLNEQRILLGLALTKIKMEKYGSNKILEIQYMHFHEFAADQFKKVYDYIVRFASELNCTHVGFDAIDKGMWKEIENLGMNEYKRYYLNELVQ